MTIENYIKNKNGKPLKHSEFNHAIALCHTLSDLKTYFKNGGGLNAIGTLLQQDRSTVRYFVKYVNEDYTIDELKTNFETILEKYLPDIEVRKKQKQEEKQRKKEARKLECSRKEHAQVKNHNLVADYEVFKTKMCNGIGQRKIKLFLNKKIKQGDKIAELYRTALELENTNINAKKYKNTLAVSYKDELYEQKGRLLKTLINLTLEYNNTQEQKIVFGYQDVYDYSTNTVIYFELPHMRQISFHCNFRHNDLINVPRYLSDWDGIENSTLFKIEEAILSQYNQELKNL